MDTSSDVDNSRGVAIVSSSRVVANVLEIAEPQRFGRKVDIERVDPNTLVAKGPANCSRCGDFADAS